MLESKFASQHWNLSSTVPYSNANMGSETIKVCTSMMDQEASPELISAHDSIFGSDHQVDDDPQSADDSSDPTSVKAEQNADCASASGSAQMPVQKRRRVTRACDECRRKKIKCDGKQPCTHCSVYSYGRRLSISPISRFAHQTNMQIALTINLPTDGGTRLLNT